MAEPLDRQRTVYLLREQEDDDPWPAALASEGYVPRCIAVLSFEFVNEPQLRQALMHPGAYDGLILTSPRAAEALGAALVWLPSETAAWSGKAIYALGPRTARQLGTLGFAPEGAESGDGEQLATYITHRTHTLPLLFLCGDRRRDVLPRMLAAAGVPFEELCVYHTEAAPPADLAAQPEPAWVVFFSPTGVEAVGGSRWPGARVAAVGATTAEALERAGRAVDAVAERPVPEALVEAMRGFELSAG